MRFSQKWTSFWPRYLDHSLYIKMDGLRFSGFLGRRCLKLIYDCLLAKHTTKWTAAWFSVNSKYPWKTLNQKVVLTTVGGRVLTVNSKTRLVLPEMLSVINYVDSTRKVVSTLFYYVVSTQYVVSTHFRVETTFWVETTIWVETTSSRNDDNSPDEGCSVFAIIVFLLFWPVILLIIIVYAVWLIIEACFIWCADRCCKCCHHNDNRIHAV